MRLKILWFWSVGTVTMYEGMAHEIQYCSARELLSASPSYLLHAGKVDLRYRTDQCRRETPI